MKELLSEQEARESLIKADLDKSTKQVRWVKVQLSTYLYMYTIYDKIFAG